MIEFKTFGKISRLNRLCTITEKLDGSNGAVIIDEEYNIGVQSRNQLITVDNDHHGLATWVEANKDDLATLGPGHHFGEWWGCGIQKRYTNFTKEKNFSLFNLGRWNKDNIPKCCKLVPCLYEGFFKSETVEVCVEYLRTNGSVACPGAEAEGVIVFHHAANSYFKVTLTKDEEWKGKSSEQTS